MNSFKARARWERFVWPFFTAVLFLAFWQGAVGWSGTKIFPSPPEVATGMLELLQKHVLWNDIVDSLRRVAIGFGAAALLGVPLGLLLGWYPAANRVVNPVVQVLRPISPIAWIPVAIILFGVGNHAATSLIFLGAFFPILVASTAAVGSLPVMFRWSAHNFGLRPWQILLRVVFPAALPRILEGLRLALGIAWLVVVAAEMVAVDSGLGYLIIDSRNSGKRYDLVVAAMLLIGLIGVLLDTIFRQVESIPWVRWGFRHDV